jgi:hypothetical protein
MKIISADTKYIDKDMPRDIFNEQEFKPHYFTEIITDFGKYGGRGETPEESQQSAIDTWIEDVKDAVLWAVEEYNIKNGLYYNGN